MNSKKMLSIAAIVGAFTLGGIAAYHLSSSAAYTSTGTDTNSAQNCKGQRGGRGHGQMMGMFGIQKYIDVKSLSGDQKTTFDNAQKAFQETMKANMPAQDASGTRTQPTDAQKTAMEASFKTAWTTFMTSVRPLVASDKLTDFDAFVAQGPQKPKMGEGMGRGFGSGDKIGSGENMGKMGIGMFGIQKYIDVKSLSGDQKTTFDNAQKAFHENMQASMPTQNASGTKVELTDAQKTAMEASFKTAWTTFMTSVRPLVASDKLTDFDAFVAQGPQKPKMGEGMGRGHRGMMGDHDDQETNDDSQTGTGTAN